MSELDNFYVSQFNAVGFINRRAAQMGRASDGVINAGGGYSWVRPIDGGETRAKNTGAVSNLVSNLWVEIGENTRTGELEIIRVAPESLYTHGANIVARGATPDVPAEAFAGTIPADAISDLRVRPPDPEVGGLNVCIEGGWSDYGYFFKQHKPVSAYLPATPGTRWWVVSFLDFDNTVQFSTAYSTETMMTADLLKLAVSSVPIQSVPYGAYPLRAFILANGQTNITAVNTPFIDIRHHFDAYGISQAGWLVKTPTTIPATMVQPGTVRVAAALTVNADFYVI